MEKLSKVYTGSVLWIKIILLGVFIFGIGVVIYFLLGKNPAILKMLSGVFSKVSPSVNKTAQKVSESNNSVKIPYESLSTNSSADKTLNAMADALKMLDEKGKR